MNEQPDDLFLYEVLLDQYEIGILIGLLTSAVAKDQEAPPTTLAGVALAQFAHALLDRLRDLVDAQS